MFVLIDLAARKKSRMGREADKRSGEIRICEMKVIDVYDVTKKQKLAPELMWQPIPHKWHENS